MEIKINSIISYKPLKIIPNNITKGVINEKTNIKLKCIFISILY